MWVLCKRLLAGWLGALRRRERMAGSSSGLNALEPSGNGLMAQALLLARQMLHIYIPWQKLFVYWPPFDDKKKTSLLTASLVMNSRKWKYQIRISCLWRIQIGHGFQSKIEVEHILNVYISCLLRGYCTSHQKLACFELYLKIINNFLKNKFCIF